MNENNTFKLFFLILFILVLIVRVYFSLKQRSLGQSSWSVDEDAVRREGRWSLLLRPIAFLFMLALLALYFIEPLGSEWLHVSLP